MSVTVTRPALRYFGGKFRLAPWLITHFPPHVCYVEPFGGGAGVLLQKPVAPFEVYNDLDGGLVSFFRVLRERTAEFIQAIELTPYSRAETADAYEDSDDELEWARRLYVRSWQTRGGPRTQWRSGWRFQRQHNNNARVVDQWGQTDHLWAVAARLKTVQIECDDALQVIARYDTPETLFYCDPPYLADVRCASWARHAYQHEMTDQQHRDLAAALRDVAGYAIVSGYPSELYDELYAGWPVVDCVARIDTNDTRTERIWLSPRTAGAAGGQLRLDMSAA